MAPLRYAVRLIDREQGDLAAVEQLDGALRTQALRCEVQEVEVAGEVRLLDRAALVGGLRGVEERRTRPDGGQRIHLVLHQGDERRDHDASALAHE